ncbi:zinc dependent phospholipase C family protein [Aquirufa sp. ROCK-SH2]
MINNYNTYHKKIRLFLFFLTMVPTNISAKVRHINAIPWGFYAHKRINHLAVFTLPHPINLFYRRHLHEIEELAVLPDQRRYILDEEAARHYIDLDHYNIDSIRNTNWQQIIIKTPEDSLTKHGIVVWHIPIVYKRLVKAFVEKDSIKIIKLSAELGHYIGDAHVPLHTTSNYDGQKTGQSGIHGFWESRIPEILKENLEDWLGVAEYIPFIQKTAWQWVIESNQYVDILLLEEKKINKQFNPAKKYSFEQKAGNLIKNYSLDYTKAYHKALNNQVELRFRASIKHIGDVWYSAWLEAGQPNLE